MRNTLKMVYEELENNPTTRNSDDLLYLNIITKMQGDTKISVSDFFKTRSKKKFPPFETVSRCRRKLQREYPELAASADVEAARELLEEKVRRWAVE